MFETKQKETLNMKITRWVRIYQTLPEESEELTELRDDAMEIIDETEIYFILNWKPTLHCIPNQTEQF